MTKSKVFLILSLSFIFGIFWRSFLFDYYQILTYILLMAAVVLAAVFYKNKVALIIFVSILVFISGIWLTQSELEKIDNLNLDGKKISEKVMVAKEPIAKEKYQDIIVKTPNNLKILLNVNLYEKLRYGDELALDCALKIPENRDNEFDYQMYLAKDRIYYLCENAKYQKTGANKGNRVYSAILAIKDKMEENISKIIPEPEAALGNGLIFGGTGSLTKDVSQNFSKTGLSHIVAVSGFNVTIIAEYLMIAGIFIGLWRKQAFWFAVIGIFLFVLMVGFPSSAIRAGVMGALLLWAMKNGRLANSFNAIIFAAAIMLLLNPLLLKWDIGFQLSFLATLGIVELSPFWEEFIFKRFKYSGILENIFLTLSATVFVLPIIMYNFHTLSLVSLIANGLVLPIIPVSMLFVFLTALAGFLWQPVALIFAWLTFLPLKYIIEIVNYLANLSWASKTVENFSAEWLVVWYAMLFSIVFLLKKLKFMQKV
ncbi:MAG: ComEC/Rec2 family competence protein [bacterium]|nr:ComEC/Rec2 family competence protein [bacterium]